MYIFISDFVYSLLNKAQREFHDMFLRTYGVMYENNSRDPTWGYQSHPKDEERKLAFTRGERV